MRARVGRITHTGRETAESRRLIVAWSSSSSSSVVTITRS